MDKKAKVEKVLDAAKQGAAIGKAVVPGKPGEISGKASEVIDAAGEIMRAAEKIGGLFKKKKK